MTFNLCNTPQLDFNENLRFSARLEKIIAVIRAFSPDVIGFQEVRDYRERSAVGDLWQALSPLGYRLEFRPGNPSKLAMGNAIAYRYSKLWPRSVTYWWNSETPEEVSCSYGDDWPRVVLAIEFLPLKPLKVERGKTSFVRPHPDSSSPSLLVVNSHLGLGIEKSHPQEKLLSHRVTVRKIKQLVYLKPTFVVSLGDFNTFTDGQFYKEELDVYKSDGFRDGGALSLKNHEGIPISGTFIGFSPDTHRCSKEKFGPSLDHIFFKIYNQNPTWNIHIRNCFAGTLTGDKELDQRKVERESDFLQNSEGIDLRDSYASDHLPLMLDFELHRHRPKRPIRWSFCLILSATIALAFFLSKRNLKPQKSSN